MTRTCCIEDCQSDAKDERSLFRITDRRRNWVNIIREHQTLSTSGKLYICDLHFDPNFVTQSNGKKGLQKEAVPNINNRAQTSNDNAGDHFAIIPSMIDIDSGTSSEAKQTTNKSDNSSLVNTSDDSETSTNRDIHHHTLENLITNELESEIKIISLAKYNNLMQLVPKLAKLEVTIRAMDEKLKAKDKLISELKHELKDRGGKLFSGSIHLSTEQASVIDCLVNGTKGNKYSEDVRKFCLRQHFYSNSAYESMRQFFNKNLPSKRTLQYWYTSADSAPGINITSLKILSEKSTIYKTANHHPLHVTLISDEMAIRKQASWSSETEQFVGFCTATNSEKSSRSQENMQNKPTLAIAKDSLVFLVVGTDFKVPVAYHLLNGLQSVDRAAITLEVVRNVEETGVKVICLTSDGLQANMTVAKLLGAKFDENEPYFPSPTYPEQKIYIVFDPCHMLKLIRKHFSQYKIYSQNELIDWNLLRILVEKQRLQNFNLCNSLTHHHIDWKQKPMNVRLAAQTISRSVADALEQLKSDDYEEFQQAGATIEFLRNMNDTFDILNFADGDLIDDQYKQPICERTVPFIFSFAEEIRTYIENLEIEYETKTGNIVRKRMLESRARMGFLGFHIDLISLEGIYNDFVRDGPLQIFYPMMFSQDHLETFFSLVRNRQGSNDNPNAVEFASAFRKLLVCHPLTTSKDHNVISNATGILTISSREARQRRSVSLAEVHSFEINCEGIIQEEIDSMDLYDKHLCAYLALCIEERMIRSIECSKKSSCFECLEILKNEDERIDDPLLARKNKERSQPKRSTEQIVIFSNAITKAIASYEQEFHIQSVKKTICENLDMNELYTSSDFEHGGQSHKEKFVSQVVNAYLVLKSEKIGKRITDEERGAFIRSRLKAAVHVAGQ